MYLNEIVTKDRLYYNILAILHDINTIYDDNFKLLSREIIDNFDAFFNGDSMLIDGELGRLILITLADRNIIKYNNDVFYLTIDNMLENIIKETLAKDS